MTKQKMTITPAEVRRLGELSRLNIGAGDEEKLREQLSSIIDYFRVVDGISDDVKLGRSYVEPSELRGDDAAASDPDGVLRGVPQKKGRLVKAPWVF